MAGRGDRPNIILINCDDLGWGDLGCYGSEVNSTPALDTMAVEGTRFTDFYMPAPVCSPSRGAMLTGCYPPRLGFGSFDGAWVLFPGDAVGLNSNEITLAQLLKQRGYATRLVGKWHCGDQPEFLPTRFGFDSYYGLPYSNDMGRQTGGGREWPPLPLLRDEEVIQAQPDLAALTECYVEECVSFLRESREGPFFLYFAHMYVHLPLFVPESFLKDSQNGAYGGAVAEIDWSVAVLLDELKQLGLDENTLVLFTSDNGARCTHGGTNGPLRGTKGTTWEGGMRVPLIARWPSVVPAGRVCSEVASAIDFLPTLAGLAGAEVPTDRTLDGKDLAPLLTGEEGAASPHEQFFYYQCDDLEAVRSGKWKLHVAKRGQELLELYDLEADLSETTSLAEGNPDVVADLLARLEACRADLGDARMGVAGQGRRPLGRVDNPRPLTEYSEDHPYIQAMYDLPDKG